MARRFVMAPSGVQQKLEEAFGLLFNIPQVAKSIDEEHVRKSPQRMAKVFVEDFYSGCFVDPASVLATTFTNNGYDELVFVNDMRFVSSCAHHGLPFFGKAHFAYLPKNKIVGLSKIPRLVEVLSRRPQVQEKLTGEIADIFYKVLNPLGCGLVMEGLHLCMNIRGVKNESAYSRTTALRGQFRSDPSLKAEFLDGCRKSATGVLWP